MRACSVGVAVNVLRSIYTGHLVWSAVVRSSMESLHTRTTLAIDKPINSRVLCYGHYAICAVAVAARLMLAVFICEAMYHVQGKQLVSSRLQKNTELHIVPEKPNKCRISLTVITYGLPPAGQAEGAAATTAKYSVSITSCDPDCR